MRKKLFLMAFCFAGFTIVQAKTSLDLFKGSEDKLTPVADSHVTDGASADTNFGSDATLVLKKSSPGYDREIYLKFDLDGAKAFDKATLKLYVNFSGAAIATTTWQVYAVPTDTWTEATVTSKNKPESGKLLATITGQAGKTWAEWDITSQALAELSGDKKLSLRIVSTNSAGAVDATFASKEGSAAFRPQLVLSK